VKFNYKDVAKEQGWNFEKIDPIIEYESNFNYYKEVISKIKPTTKMLDIGCGSGEKALKFYGIAKEIYMIDNEEEMLKKVVINNDRINDLKTRKKFIINKGDCHDLSNYYDDCFDLVVSRHCGANMKEVYRVLKSGGKFISEDIDQTDCLELKNYFGRGQGLERLKQNDIEKKKVLCECIDIGFSKIKIENIIYTEYYRDKEQLKYLLTHTPILDYYNNEEDDIILDKYIKEYKTDKGIKLVRRLYAFVMKK